jgi:hypothetical protein
MHLWDPMHLTKVILERSGFVWSSGFFRPLSRPQIRKSESDCGLQYWNFEWDFMTTRLDGEKNEQLVVISRISSVDKVAVKNAFRKQRDRG